MSPEIDMARMCYTPLPIVFFLSLTPAVIRQLAFVCCRGMALECSLDEMVGFFRSFKNMDYLP